MFKNFFAQKIGIKKENNIISSYNKALSWLKDNTIPEQGIIVSSKRRIPYLEVTGYLIPTLMDAGENKLAEQYAEFLFYVQRPNGAFAGPDGKGYIFDTAQALRGLLRASQLWDRFKPFALKTADYITSSIENDGRIPSIYGKEIPEYVHVYILPVLAEAAKILNKPEYLEIAKGSLIYYKNAPDILDDNRLTHFLAYTLDGFIDMGESEFVRPLVKEIFSSQRKYGDIPAFPNVKWTCNVGTAQFVIIGYKLEMYEKANEALNYLCHVQNTSGGFYGSYGIGADYFQKEEISWANKFFIDAIHLQNKVSGGLLHSKYEIKGSKALNSDEWHKVIIGKNTVQKLINKIKSNQFPVWCKPLLQHSSPHDSILELGSGTGELSAILAIYGKIPHLLDYSEENIKHAKDLFQELGIKGHFYCADIIKGIPIEEKSVDWVWSSGLLEHFSDEQIVDILKESVRVCRKGVMSLVPNASSIFYRIGKFKMEQEGTWAYGRETPKFTMKDYFNATGLKNIKEFSVGTYHSLSFWGKDEKEIKNFYDNLSFEELQNLNQGYLLFTYGEK